MLFSQERGVVACRRAEDAGTVTTSTAKPTRQDTTDSGVGFTLLARREPTAPPGSFVHRLGLVAPAFATIQIDLNPVSRSADGGRAEITLCDHNCTAEVHGTATGGRYTCPAAISLNRGGGRGDLAPTRLLAAGLRTTVAGTRTAQERFLTEDLPRYLDEQQVPDVLREEFRTALATQRIVVNLFGGSPELHPGCLDLIEDLHEQGVEVHLTTTGRRLLQDEAFLDDFLRRPPDVLALGADDFDSPSDVDELFALDYEALGRAWRRVPWTHGQRRKAIEAVQVCLLARRLPFPPLLFNVVLHGGNLAWAGELLDRLDGYVDAALNPYPVQSAFLGGTSGLSGEDLTWLRELTESAVEVHATHLRGGRPRWNLVPRLGYWMLLLSLLTGGATDQVRADRVGGDGVWQCFRRRGAGRCVQVGVAAPGSAKTDHPGGHLGCFWNTGAIADDRQIWDRAPGQVADWVLEGRQQAAREARQRAGGEPTEPCRGCLFPRMSTDMVSLELGLAPELVDHYRTVRAKYLGY
jgi:hypothetical protein